MNEIPVVLMTDAEKVARYEEALTWVLNFPRTLDTAVRERVRIALEGEEVPMAREVVSHAFAYARSTTLWVYADEVEQLENDARLYGGVFTKLNDAGVAERVDPATIIGLTRLLGWDDAS